MKKNLFTKLYNIIQKRNVLKKYKILLYYFDTLLLLFIKKPKYKHSKKKKVLIVYNLALGDGVIFNCSCHNYRKLFPKKDYEITFLCQNGVESLYLDNKIFDKIINMNFMKSVTNIGERFKIFKQLRQTYYDIVIDPVGVFECTTNVLISRAVVAKEKIGIIDYNKEIFLSEKIINKIYTKIYFINKNKMLPLVEYYQKVISLISNNTINDDVGLVELKVNKPKIDIPKDYFVIFPSASIELKKWPIERYREIAKRIYNKTKLPLVVCGTNADYNSVSELIRDLDIEVINLLGKTNLNDYFYIIKNAKFVITNDTSAYHIAVVNQTPVVIVSGGYDFERFIKYDFKNKAKYRKPYIAVNEKKCFNCNDNCPYFKKEDKVWICLNEITVDMVWNKVNELIINEKIGE